MIAGVVLSASEDGMLRLWESRSGNFIATIAAYQSAFAGMATSEDAHVICSANDRRSRIGVIVRRWAKL